MAQQQTLVLALSNNLAQLRPGRSTDLTAKITNAGREVERFEMRLIDLDPTWFHFEQTEFLLYPEEPGNEMTVQIHLTIPAQVKPGIYNATLQVFSAKHSRIVADERLVISIEGDKTPQLQIDPPEQIVRGQTAYYRLQVKNPLYYPVTLEPAFDAANGLQATFEPARLDLSPFSEGEGQLAVHLPARLLVGADRPYQFSLHAPNLAGPVEARLVQSCRWPWLRRVVTTPLWLAAAALVLVLLLGGLVWLLWPRGGGATSTQAGVVPTCVAPNRQLTTALQTHDGLTDILVKPVGGSSWRKVGQENADRLPGLFAPLVSVSPDGQNLAYVTARNEALDDATLNTLNLTTLTRQTVTRVSEGLWTSAPVWSGDSSQLAFVVRGGPQLGLWQISLASSDHRARQIAAPSQLTPGLYYGETAKPVCWAVSGESLLLNTGTGRPTPNLEIALANGQVRDISKVGSNNPPPVVQTPAAFKALPNERVSYALAPPSPTVGPTQPETPREPPLAPAGDGECFVRPLSQNAPEWSGQSIKALNQKIGEAGCPFTAAAMMLNYYNVETDPTGLNSCLEKQNSPLDWSALAGLCSQGQVNGGQQVAFSWDSLNQTLKRGQPVIVGLLGGQTGVHYVVVVGGTASLAATYRVNDPWDGTDYKSLGYFLNMGYQLRWLVTYTGNNAPKCQSRGEGDQANPFSLKLVSPADGSLNQQPVAIKYETQSDAPATATLYTLQTGLTPPSDANASDETASATLPDPQKVASGQQLDKEGAYELVLQSGSEGQTQDVSRLTAHFVIDHTPPTLQLVSINGPLDADPANPTRQTSHQPVSFQLQAADRLSGIALIQYRLNDSDWANYPTGPTTPPITLDKAGAYRIEYRAYDGAGNLVNPPPLNLQIDNGAGTSGAEAGSTTTGVSPVVTATTPAATTAAPDNSNATPTVSAAPTTPAVSPTPTAAPVGSLLATPALLNFDATQDQLNFQLTNNGPIAINWTIQPPTGAAANYLRFTQSSGILPPGGSLPIVVSLSNLNLTGRAINSTFNLAYNNGSTLVPLSVLIAPQPAPSVQFIAPASGPLTVSSTVSIRLQVSSSGLAKPVYAALRARYADKTGSLPTDHPLNAQATPDNNWTIAWPLPALPPQDNIGLAGKICYSADDSACTEIPAALTGLSIPKPTATFSLDSTSDFLNPKMTISAKTTPPLDHISYSYTYAAQPNQPTSQALPDRATAANNWTVVWDTTRIPPQNGVRLTARLCWDASDDPASCVEASGLPTTLSVRQPGVTINALAASDAASLPVNLALAGNVTGLNGSASAVWVSYKYLPVGSTTPVEREDQATLSPAGNSPTNWQLNLDTAGWSPQQSLTFTPKVCWDGDRGGNYCYAATTPATGAIPALTAQFATPVPSGALPGTVTLAVQTQPAGRVASVQFLLSYTASDGTSKTDQLLSQTANSTNQFSISFDSVALGLKSGQNLTFKLVACTQPVGAVAACGQPASASPGVTSFSLPDTSLTFTPALTVLTRTTSLKASVTGRGFSNARFWAVYKPLPGATATVTSTVQLVAATNAGQNFQVNWDPALIPPQSGVSLDYELCWGPGDLGQSCATYEAYSGVNVPEPQVVQVFINGNQPYTKADPLPITINSAVPSTINLPVQLSVSGNARYVTWQLSAGKVYSSTVATSTVNINNNQAVSVLPLDLGQLKTALGGNLTATPITLTATPVWQAENGTLLPYTAPTNTGVLGLKLVDLNLNIQTVEADSNSWQPLLPAPADLNPLNLIMRSNTTNFSGKIPNLDPNSPARWRMLFYVYYDTLDYQPIITNSTQLQTLVQADGSWMVSWNHAGTTPAIAPRGGLGLAWRLCNTLGSDYSGCLPLTMTGSLDQVKGLTLGGLRFNAMQPAPTGSANILSSNFTATVQLSFANPSTQLRFFAYPTPANGSLPDPAQRLLLAIRADMVVDAARTNWQIGVYWPENPPAISKLLTAINANGNKLNIGVQYCLTPLGANPSPEEEQAQCNEWSGTQVGQLDPAWAGSVQGTQPVVAVWQPYDNKTYSGTNDPYNLSLKVPGVNQRSLGLKIYYVNTGLSAVVINNIGLSYAYNGATPLIGPATSQTTDTNSIVLSTFYTYSNWNITGLFTPTVSRDVQLIANITFQQNAQAYQVRNTIWTYGNTTS